MKVVGAVRKLMRIPSLPRMFHPIVRRFVSNTAALLPRYGESDETRHVDAKRHEQCTIRSIHMPSACNEDYRVSLCGASSRFQCRCEDGSTQLREAEQGEKGHAQLPRMQTEKGQMHLRVSIGRPL
jgi:hypothetical protein